MTEAMRALDGSMTMALMIAGALLLLSLAVRGISARYAHRPLSWRAIVWSAAIVGWAAAVAYITLVAGITTSTGSRPVELVPGGGIVQLLTDSVSVEVPLVQIGGNAVLFAPFGVLLALRHSISITRCIGWAALASVAIEATQFAFALGRVASVDDVLVNTLGAVAGFALVRVVQYVMSASDTQLSERR